MKKITVQTSQTSQTANELLGKAATNLYYLVLGEKPNQVVINVGEKTKIKVDELIKLTK